METTFRWFFHWSLSDCKSPQVSWTFHSILADLNTAVVLYSLDPCSDLQYFSKPPSEFLHQRWLIIFLWILSDSWSPQVSRTFHSILAELNTDVVLYSLDTCSDLQYFSKPPSELLHQHWLIIFLWILSDS